MPASGRTASHHHHRPVLDYSGHDMHKPWVSLSPFGTLYPRIRNLWYGDTISARVSRMNCVREIVMVRRKAKQIYTGSLA